ncbi:MAG: LamG-like jellyroll fold domain-containing protein [Flavobacteriales bacterium]
MKKSLLISILCLFALSLFSQNSLHFDGVNDKVDCGNNTSVQITGTSITLEAWIYPTSFKPLVWQGNIINKEGNQIGYMLRAGGTGQLNFNIGTGAWNELNSPINTLTLNTWQHVAATYDGSFMRIFRNGIIIDSVARTASISQTTQNLVIGEGSFYTGRYFPGRIDEVRIWNVARTKAQIIADMNRELCQIPRSLKTYYSFNHGIANGTNTGVTSVTDLSGNNNTGTLSGSSLSGTTSNWTTGASLTAGIANTQVPVTTCGSYTLPNGTVVTTAGTYYDTLATSAGCDSLIGYQVTFSAAHIANTNTIAACASYTMPNGSIINSSGTYYDTISSATGCDTLDSYVISISGAVDDSVFRVGGRITAWDTWAGHQWVRCDSNFAPINGETSRTILATQAGDYAVIVSRGVCVDTSDCINIMLSGLDENRSTNFSVFPNPATDYITLGSEIPFSKKNLAIYNTTGQLIKNITSTRNRIDIENLTNGLYFIQITTNNTIYHSKFIKN